jgi:endopeptidase Clp ATP-binding regulatory subunit ClpX
LKNGGIATIITLSNGLTIHTWGLSEMAKAWDSDSKIPDQKELEKELNEYLGKKYGDRIRLVVPMLFPKAGTGDAGGKGKRESNKLERARFDMKPEELEAYLNEYVIKQDEAKAVLATKICTHFNRINFLEKFKKSSRFEGVGNIKNNIIMIGPTGVGKTYLIKLIAKKIGVPFVKGDATKFSETGYVGGDVEDLVRDLVYEAKGDIEWAQYGIIYVDEIDKIASSINLIGPDVSRTGVQRALLKPMEETEVDLKVPHDPISQLEAIEQYRKTGKKEKKVVNTKNILFIVSGAFNDLNEIIKKRMRKEGIGFGAQIRSKDEKTEYFKHVKAEDLIEYGFESEFIGRLPVIVVFERLEVEDLYHILKNPNNPIIIGKKRDFKSYGIDVQFEDEALYKLAERACEEKTGARGLVSAVEKVLLKFEKKLPSTTIRKMVVTPSMVEDPEGELEKLLNMPQDEALLARFEVLAGQEKDVIKEIIKRREGELLRKYGMVVCDERFDLIADRVIDKGFDIDTIYEEILIIERQIRDYEESFYKKHGIGIEFDESAIAKLTELALEEGNNTEGICQGLTENFEHGFKLIRDRTGQSRFVLTGEAVDDPQGYLNKVIKETYSESTPLLTGRAAKDGR